MRTQTSLRLVLCLVACAAGAQPQKQKSLPRFPSQVELITVDAVVLDAEGRPVVGLGRDDFTISEDGREREIASFEAFVQEPAVAAPAQRTLVADNQPSARSVGRAFAIVLDDVRIAPPLAEAARQAAAAFVERSTRDGDGVSVATSSGSVWWSARIPEGREDLRAVLARVNGVAGDAPGYDSVSEYEAYWISNRVDSPALSAGGAAGSAFTLPGRAGAQPAPDPAGGMVDVKARVIQRWQKANLCTIACDQMVRARAAEIDARRLSRTRLTLKTLRRSLDALALVHGRKALLLFSEGLLEDHGSGLRDVVAASREANTAVYFIDVRGLVALPGFGTAADAGPPPDARDISAMRFEENSLASAGSQDLADQSGGFSVRNTNDLAGAAERISDESRVFYLLGFYPPEGKSEREWRKLRVEVKRPGLTVRARRGYTLRVAAAPPALDAPAQKGKQESFDPVVARALDSSHAASGIPLRLMTYVLEPRPKDVTHVVAAVELDASRLALESKGKLRLGHLEVSVIATHRDSGRGFRHDDTTDVVFEGDDAPGWRAFIREFELAAGISQVRAVVRDTASGAFGSVSQRFEVPQPGGLRVSTPILTDHLAPGQAGQARPQPALAVHRTFRPQGSLYCQYEVFGAASPTAEHAPRVAAGLELRTSDGSVVRKAPPTPIAVDPDGRMVRLIGIGLDGMRSGDYELVLDVQDLVGGARLERREPFTLAPEAALP